jgi:hypothetical protein
MSDTYIQHKDRNKAENIAKILNPTNATPAEVAAKINDLIDALINSRQMKSE